MKITRENVFNFSLILVLAIFIFLSSDSLERYTQLHESLEAVYHNQSEDYYWEISEEAIIVEEVPNMISKIINKFKYDKICFEIKESKFVHPGFEKSSLIISINYGNQTKEVTTIPYDSDYTKKCFKIIDRKRIDWEWLLDSRNLGVKSFLNTPLQEKILEFKAEVYLKTSWLYLLYLSFISFFYSGLFWWACSRILEFIRNGFKSK